MALGLRPPRKYRPFGAATRVVLEQDAADPDQVVLLWRLGWPLGRGLVRAGWG